MEQVPIEYLDDFRCDPEQSLRDIVGVATDTIRPFISRRDKIIDAIEQGREEGLEHWVDNCDIDLAIDDLPQ